MPPDQVDDVQLLQDIRGSRTVAQVGFAGSIPADLEPRFTDLFRANCEAFLQQYRATFCHGSFLVYLEGLQMDDREKQRVLEALTVIAQKTTEQLGLPELNSPTLQISNSLYSLSASGDLGRRDCKRQPQLLSARVVSLVSNPTMVPVGTQHSAQHSVGLLTDHQWQLVALAADAPPGDQLRLHFEDGSRTMTMDAQLDKSASRGQFVQLTVIVPQHSKRVVELLRDSFASQRVGVSYPSLLRQHVQMGLHPWTVDMSAPEATSQCKGTGRTAI